VNSPGTLIRISERSRRRLCIAAAVAVLLISCVWMIAASDSDWGWIIILAFLVTFAGLQLMVLGPLTYLFYRLVSRPRFLQRGAIGFASCVGLGAVIGMLVGLVIHALSFYSEPGMNDTYFPAIQGALLAVFFRIFLTRGMFFNRDREIQKRRKVVHRAHLGTQPRVLAFGRGRPWHID